MPWNTAENQWFNLEKNVVWQTYAQPGKSSKHEETCLDEVGFHFVRTCIRELENRGLEDQGLYRLVGVSSKVNKLLSMGLDRRKVEKINLEDRLEWENKTITSAIKTYLRQLPEPLMSFRYHTAFIAAASNFVFSILNFHK